jgi:nucleotide-binding universal stress UspA family protein
MFNHILIPTDGSDLSRKALLYAVEIARESKAKVTALTVRPAYVIGSMDMIGVVGGQDEFEAETRRYAEYALTQAKSKPFRMCPTSPIAPSSIAPTPTVATSSSWLRTAGAASRR